MNNWSLAHFRRNVRVERFLKEVGIFLEKGRTLFGKRSASFLKQHSNGIRTMLEQHSKRRVKTLEKMGKYFVEIG